MSVLATCNAAFPVGRVDNLLAVEEHLLALSARIRDVVTEAVRQGAAMALAAAQLQIKTVVNLGVTEQGFPPRSTDNEIADLIESLEPAANAVLPKVDVGYVGHISSFSSHE